MEKELLRLRARELAETFTVKLDTAEVLQCDTLDEVDHYAIMKANEVNWPEFIERNPGLRELPEAAKKEFLEMIQEEFTKDVRDMYEHYVNLETESDGSYLDFWNSLLPLYTQLKSIRSHLYELELEIASEVRKLRICANRELRRKQEEGGD